MATVGTGTVRRAEVSWNGDLRSGTGTASAGTSGVFRDLPVSWASRTERAEGRTSPEELLAASHAACFAMAFSGALAKNQTPPQNLSVSAEVSFEQRGGAWQVGRSALTVRGSVPGIDAETFRRLADDAKENCPISKALKGNVDLSVDAQLEG